MEKHPYKKPPFSLDRTRRRKLTEQLASSLRTAIETGYYKPGETVPPVRELAAEVGVSPGIAARALARIREEHARELQAKDREIDSLRALVDSLQQEVTSLRAQLEDAWHTRDFAQDTARMLLKQNSREDTGTDGENR